MLKVESDGVTFSHDDGITKILFPFLPPDLQKQFGYDPQKATAEADAQLRFDQQQQARDQQRRDDAGHAVGRRLAAARQQPLGLVERFLAALAGRRSPA